MKQITTYFTAFFAAFTFQLAVADTEPGITRTEPLPGNTGIFRMAGGGSVLVTDGARTRLADGTWIDNCFTFGVFDFEDGVFHGWRQNENFKYVIQTSPDGVTWTDVGSGKEFDGINTATYDNGKYLVAYSRFDRDQIFVSTNNGATWTETNGVFAAAGIELSNTFVSGYGFGRWFLRAGGQTVVGFLTSTDGISWSEAAVPMGTPTAAYGDSGIAFGGGVGLVSVGNSLLRTTDGTTWTEVKRFSNGLRVNGIAYNGGNFLLARTDFSQKFILESSTDLGATFNIIPNVHENRLSFIQNLRQVKAIAPWKTGFAVAGENGFVLGTEDVTMGEPSFQRLTDSSLYHFNNYPFQMVANGGTLVRYFTGGVPRNVQTSTDGGFTWTAPVTALEQSGGTPVLIAAGGKYFLRDIRRTSVSSDAITWAKAVSTDKNPAQFNSDLWAYAIVFDGTRWVAIIEENTASGFRKFISASPDGLNWTKTGTVPVASTSAANERMLYVGGEYFYVSYDPSGGTMISIHRSKDLTNWSLLIPPYNGFDTSPISIHEDGGRWLVLGAGAAKVSDDGVTFFNVPSLSLMPFSTSNIVKVNGKFYSPGNDSMMVSDDLFFWKNTAAPSTFQRLLTVNANGILLADEGRNPRYLDELPTALPPEVYNGPPIAIAPGSAGKIKISIPTEDGKFYYIQTNPKLNLPLWNYDFTNLPFITGDGTVQEIEFTPSGSSGFFRLQTF